VIEIKKPVQELTGLFLLKGCCKPDSVLFLHEAIRALIIYLLCLPSPMRCIKRATLLRRIEVYMTFQPARFIHPQACTWTSWALTSRFHLYPDVATREVIFWDTLCYRPCGQYPCIRWYGALRCPDFPLQ